jgi:hypothetical protein
MTEHILKYEKNATLGLYRAICTCGWLDVQSNLEVLKCRAALHGGPEIRLLRGEWEELKGRDGHERTS